MTVLADTKVFEHKWNKTAIPDNIFMSKCKFNIYTRMFTEFINQFLL